MTGARFCDRCQRDAEDCPGINYCPICQMYLCGGCSKGADCGHQPELPFGESTG